MDGNHDRDHGRPRNQTLLRYLLSKRHRADAAHRRVGGVFVFAAEAFDENVAACKRDFVFPIVGERVGFEVGAFGLKLDVAFEFGAFFFGPVGAGAPGDLGGAIDEAEPFGEARSLFIDEIEPGGSQGEPRSASRAQRRSGSVDEAG